jgi:hypothetical protein
MNGTRTRHVPTFDCTHSRDTQFKRYQARKETGTTKSTIPPRNQLLFSKPMRISNS